jgi:hypothetical protein
LVAIFVQNPWLLLLMLLICEMGILELICVLVKVGTQRIPDTIGRYVAIDAFGYSSVKVCSFSFCLLSNVGFIYMGQCVETVSGPADFQFVEANILVNVVMFK